MKPNSPKEIWSLSECLDSVLRPPFACLAKNYLGPMVLFTNPTKRWKTQMNYFVLFHYYSVEITVLSS